MWEYDLELNMYYSHMDINSIREMRKSEVDLHIDWLIPGNDIELYWHHYNYYEEYIKEISQ